MDRGISTGQLHSAVLNLLDKNKFKTNEYLGVFAIDNVDDLIANCKSCIDKKVKLFWLIYNNEPSSESGEHWRVIIFYRNLNKWRIYIYDSLGGDSLLKSYPNLLSGIKNLKKSRNLTDDYKHKDSIYLNKYDINVNKQTTTIINNKGDTEEKYFNDILRLIQSKNKRYKIRIETILNRLQADYTPTCGLYCLFFIDIGILPLYEKGNKIIERNITRILKNHGNFFSNIFYSQTYILPLGGNTKERLKTIAHNEKNIKSIYKRYLPVSV